MRSLLCIDSKFYDTCRVSTTSLKKSRFSLLNDFNRMPKMLNFIVFQHRFRHTFCPLWKVFVTSSRGPLGSPYWRRLPCIFSYLSIRRLSNFVNFCSSKTYFLSNNFAIWPIDSNYLLTTRWLFVVLKVINTVEYSFFLDLQGCHGLKCLLF